MALMHEFLAVFKLQTMQKINLKTTLKTISVRLISIVKQLLDLTANLTPMLCKQV